MRGASKRALPARAAKPERPVRVGIAFLALREDAHVLLRRAPGGRPARRHAGGAFDGLGRDAAARQRGAAHGAGAGGVVGGAGRASCTPSRTSAWRRWSIAPIVPADASLTFWADPQRCQWVARRDLDRAALPTRDAQDHRPWVARIVGWVERQAMTQHHK